MNTAHNDNCGFDSAWTYLRSCKFLQKTYLLDIIKNGIAKNPYEEGSDQSLMWLEQCLINFPLLYLASIYLYIFASKNGYDTFLFTTRDCCHWHKIFTALFPHTKVHIFHTSRHMLNLATNSNHRAYHDYVKTLVKGGMQRVICVDIFASCKKIFKYFQEEFGDVPHCFLLSCSFKNYSDFPEISRHYHKEGKLTALVFDNHGCCETLNYDVVGMLQNYKNGPVRDPPEYETKIIQPYHNCINTLINRCNMTQLEDEISQLSENEKKYIMENIQTIVKDLATYVYDKKDDDEHDHASIIEDEVEKVKKRDECKKIKCSSKNKDINFDDIHFKDILSDTSVYSIVWNGTYNGNKCVIKTMVLESGMHCDNEKSKYYDGKGKRVINGHKYFKKNDNEPFLHKDFSKRKPVDMHTFLKEVKNIITLNSLDLAPDLYGYTVHDSGPIHYGFIVMEKVDCCLKDIIMERDLKNSEDIFVKDFLNDMHKNREIIHGDNKPSNIGCYLNHHGHIKKCVLIDCQYIKYRKDYNKNEWKEAIDHAWDIYRRHFIKNTDKRIS